MAESSVQEVGSCFMLDSVSRTIFMSLVPAKWFCFTGEINQG